MQHSPWPRGRCADIPVRTSLTDNNLVEFARLASSLEIAHLIWLAVTHRLPPRRQPPPLAPGSFPWAGHTIEHKGKKTKISHRCRRRVKECTKVDECLWYFQKRRGKIRLTRDLPSAEFYDGRCQLFNNSGLPRFVNQPLLVVKSVVVQKVTRLLQLLGTCGETR